MAVSDTNIANRALRLLKARSITSLTDGSKNANVANDVFDEVRADLLRGHTWHFARRLLKLARLSTAPAFGFDYAYALPADWIRTVSFHDNDAGTGAVDYEEIEVADVGALASSIEDAYLKYVYAVVDPNRMTADFRTALSYGLAVTMPGISNISAAAWELLEKDAISKVNRAKSSDSLGSPAAQRPVGSWVASRQSWPSTRWPR